MEMMNPINKHLWWY